LCEKPEHIKFIIDTIANNITEIIQNPYGNYAVTEALEVHFLLALNLIIEME
jgi:hypothetical protein